MRKLPTVGSWLVIAQLVQHALKRGSHISVPELTAAISEYIETHNEDGKPFVWTKTADEILEKVKRFGQRTVRIHGEGK